jgi:hypothetical protein
MLELAENCPKSFAGQSLVQGASHAVSGHVRVCSDRIQAFPTLTRHLGNALVEVLVGIGPGVVHSVPLPVRHEQVPDSLIEPGVLDLGLTDLLILAEYPGPIDGAPYAVLGENNVFGPLAHGAQEADGIVALRDLRVAMDVAGPFNVAANH